MQYRRVRLDFQCFYRANKGRLWSRRVVEKVCGDGALNGKWQASWMGDRTCETRVPRVCSNYVLATGMALLHAPLPLPLQMLLSLPLQMFGYRLEYEYDGS